MSRNRPVTSAGYFKRINLISKFLKEHCPMVTKDGGTLCDVCNMIFLCHNPDNNEVDLNHRHNQELEIVKTEFGTHYRVINGRTDLAGAYMSNKHRELWCQQFQLRLATLALAE